MTHPLYDASVPVFKQMLNSLNTILFKAETYMVEKKIEPSALLQARLYPDMLTFTRQVQIACDFAKGVSARLANVEVPTHEDTEQTFEDLHARIEKVLTFISSLDAARFTDSELREVVLRPGTPKEKRMLGQPYLLHYGIPQFFFHVMTAYALLRHNGVQIGKQDYMGMP